MRLSRPAVMNGVREYSRLITKARESHNTALQRVILYILKTRDRGLLLAPDGTWDRRRKFVFFNSRNE